MPWTIKKAILIKISFNTSLSDIAFSSYKAKSRDCAEPEVLNLKEGWANKVHVLVRGQSWFACSAIIAFYCIKIFFLSSKVLSKREISLSIFVYY